MKPTEQKPLGFPKADEAPAQTQALAPVQQAEPQEIVPIQVLRPTSFKEAQQMATLMAQTHMVPEDYRGKPHDIIVAWQMGAELGLPPMQALQNIANIKGRPAVWGDAALALCKGHHSYQDVTEWLEGTGDAMVAYCRAERKGKKDVVREFSVDDAKQAGLWMRKANSGSTMPWSAYPKRMLQMRARGFALRDQWPDVLRGIHTAEEVMDLPPIIEAVAEPRVDLDKAGTQSFRKPADDAPPATPEKADPPAPARRPDKAGPPPATRPDVELKAVAESLEMITQSQSKEQLQETGRLIKDVSGKWSEESTTEVREAYIERWTAVVPPAGNEPDWPGEQPPAPPADQKGFGF